MFRNSSTYLYLAVFLGLVCYLTFIDKKIPGTRDQEESESQLFKLEPEGVTSLEIKNLHGLFIFKKVNNHWEVKSPINTLADGATIDGVISQIALAQPQRIIKVDNSETDTAHLKEWGLLPEPAERVVIHNDKNQQYILLVGRKTAISDSVYARASERKTEPVRVIPLTVKEALQKDLTQFRSRNVFDFEPENVAKIATHIADTTTAPGQQVEIDRKDEKWMLQMPLVARASSADVQALLGKILGERIVDFVTDDASNLSQYGLTSPAATMTITLKPEEELVLQIGGPVPGKPDQVYAQRLKSNSVFTLSRAGVDDLFKAVPNVRDRHILAFDPGKATGVSFSYGNRKGAAQKDDKGLWKTEGDSEGRADVARVTDILSRLSQLETTPLLKDSATDLKPFGLDKPAGKITINSPEYKSPLTLYIGKAENKLLYVRNSLEPFVYTIPDNALDFLPANNLALLDLRVINLTLKDVRRMTITAGSAPTVALDRSSGGTWSAANVKDRMVDTMKAETQASLFCGLVAVKWLGPALPAYGLAKPELTISAEVVDKPKPRVLRVGAKLPDGGHAAQIEGEPNVFEMNDADYGILNTSSLQLVPSVLSATNAPSGLAPSTNAPSTNAPAHAAEKK